VEREKKQTESAQGNLHAGIKPVPKRRVNGCAIARRLKMQNCRGSSFASRIKISLDGTLTASPTEYSVSGDGP
jgi:hypothetical protein